jgi:hypothetical protein
MIVAELIARLGEANPHATVYLDRPGGILAGLGIILTPLTTVANVGVDCFGGGQPILVPPEWFENGTGEAAVLLTGEDHDRKECNSAALNKAA